MLIAEPTYDLKTLCDLAGVTVRTVRFYIQQGLLPSPGLGAGARYTDEHLALLRMIRHLQRAHLPLAEIRRVLSKRPEPEDESPAYDPLMATQVTEPEAHANYLVAPEDAEPPQRVGRRASTAAEYIRGILREREVRFQERREEPPTPRPGSHREQWERIELAEDVELHVRRPLTRELNRRLDRLLQAARRIFEEEP